MNTLIKNASIYTGISDRWITGDLFIKGGKIDKIGSFSVGNEKIDETIDGTGKIVMPGLINAHAHSYTGLLKGTVNNVPLDIYMLYAIAGGSFRTPEEIYTSTMIDVLQMLKSGTTSVVDHFSERPALSIEGMGSTVKAFIDGGMRATIAPMYADKSYFETVPMEKGEFPEHLKVKGKGKPQTPEEYGYLCEEAIKKFHNKEDRIRITIGTDGPQRCSRELLDITARLEEKYQVGWHSHILEAKTQAIMGHRLYGKGLIEQLDEFGLINERTSLVHFVWVSEKEAQIIIDRKSNMVHCPSSNLFLGSGIAPVDLYLKEGMNIAIGTDGGNCGNENMFERVRLLANLHRVGQPDYNDWISSSRALEVVLHGGARAMLLEDKIGSIEVGKAADLLILDTNNTLWQPINNYTNQLVYGETGSSIESVFVAGRKVVDHGKSTLVNEQEIIERAREAVARLRVDNREAFELADKQVPYFRKMHLRAVREDLGYSRYIRKI